MKKHSIPLIFAITGHRDLRSEDIYRLTNRITELFQKYQKNYPNTELILLSPLAEGADILVANVAIKLGITLHVLLPYTECAYLDSFDDAQKREEFASIKEYASRVETLPCDHCDQELGEYLADTSNILIALWDGVDNGESSGTSTVIKYIRQGFELNRFDALDDNALIIIQTSRVSNSNIESDFSVVCECLGKHLKGIEFEKMLKQIDSLNAEAKITKLEEGSISKTYKSYFEEKARKNQTRYKNYSKALLILTFIAIASLEIMHVIHLDHFIIGYGVGLLLAFGLYHFFMEKGKIQDDFIYSRGFSEALRIQNAWNHAKLDKSVAKHYLHNQHHKFTWLKTILKNLFYLDSEPFNPYNEPCSVNSWIDGQIEYFKEKSEERHRKFKKLEKWEKRFYKMGVIVLISMFILYIVQITKYPLNDDLKVIPHINNFFQFFWHILVLISSLLLMVAAFISEKYIKIEGYEEEIYHFNDMLSTFSDAKEALSGVDESSGEYKAIVYDLGLKALNENSKWVVLHNRMRAEPSLE